LKEAIIEPEINVFEKVHGIPIYEYFEKDQQINNLFNKAMCNIPLLRYDELPVNDSLSAFKTKGKMVNSHGGSI
jgi:hypothetical protein